MEGLTNAVTNSKKEGPSSKGVQRDFLEEAGTELRGADTRKVDRQRKTAVRSYF